MLKELFWSKDLRTIASTPKIHRSTLPQQSIQQKSQKDKLTLPTRNFNAKRKIKDNRKLQVIITHSTLLKQIGRQFFISRAIAAENENKQKSSLIIHHFIKALQGADCLMSTTDRVFICKQIGAWLPVIIRLRSSNISFFSSCQAKTDV